MAAFLRSGARKLVPSALVQRTSQASGVVDLRHLLLPRSFMTTATMERARARPESLSKAMEEIHERKDELYDLLCKEKPTDSLNRQLLRSLSTQVNPRPDDPEWRRMYSLRPKLLDPLLPRNIGKRGPTNLGRREYSFKMLADVMGSTIAMLGPLLAVTVILSNKAVDYLDEQKAKKAAGAAKERN